MKIETKQKIKEFYEKRKLEIIAGSLIVGGIIIACILKPGKVEVHDVTNIEVLPDWAEKWKQKCIDEDLTPDKGLPVYANDEKTIMYDDVFVDRVAMEDWRENGFTIIERT